MTVNCIARSSPKVSYAHFRTERISLTAAIPLLAMRTYEITRQQNSIQGLSEVLLTLVMTVCPSLLATKSLTELAGATSKWFPPMK